MELEDPFSKSANMESLRRWRQAALILNASRRFRYTLDIRREVERAKQVEKIRAHAAVIRAAILFRYSKTELLQQNEEAEVSRERDFERNRDRWKMTKDEREFWRCAKEESIDLLFQVDPQKAEYVVRWLRSQPKAIRPSSSRSPGQSTSSPAFCQEHVSPATYPTSYTTVMPNHWVHLADGSMHSASSCLTRSAAKPDDPELRETSSAAEDEPPVVNLGPPCQIDNAAELRVSSAAEEEPPLVNSSPHAEPGTTSFVADNESAAVNSASLANAAQLGTPSAVEEQESAFLNSTPFHHTGNAAEAESVDLEAGVANESPRDDHEAGEANELPGDDRNNRFEEVLVVGCQMLSGFDAIRNQHNSQDFWYLLVGFALTGFIAYLNLLLIYGRRRESKIARSLMVIAYAATIFGILSIIALEFSKKVNPWVVFGPACLFCLPALIWLAKRSEEV